MRRALAGLLLAAAAAHAETPVESWTTLEVPVWQKDRVTTLLHSQLRVRQNLSDFYSARFGPQVRVRLTHGFTLITGFWYTSQENSKQTQWDDMHRYWAGFERPFRVGNSVVQVRGIYEHWFGGPRPNDNRTRWLALYRRPLGRGMTLNVGSETFTDNHGYVAERLIGNVGLPLSRQFTIEAGYMWDKRLERVGGVRHMLTTTIRPRLRDR